MRKKEKTGNESVKIIPLGGLEQIGMNITAFETEKSIIVVDCGLAFPGDDMLEWIWSFRIFLICWITRIR